MMVRQLKETIKIGKVVLKVKNLYSMIDFYQNQLGLDVLESSKKAAVLGLGQDNRELIEFREIKNPNSPSVQPGLFHLALLLPKRSDLGNTLYTLAAKKQVPLQGASDHGYSEALYLADPEGNGIEIYWDKPKSEWNIQEDGTIVGVTKQMDAQGVLDARDKSVSTNLPNGTIMGHVHLMVRDIKEAKSFYVDTLGFDLKYQFGSQALFVAAGEYHHHIGLNSWNTKGKPVAKAKDLGLDYFVVLVEDVSELNKVKHNLVERNFDLEEETNDSITVVDPNNISIQFKIGT